MKKIKNMNVSRLLKIGFFLLFVYTPLPYTGGGGSVYAQTHYVMIETNMGNMKVMLYDDTPKTTANFMKKVKEGYYNETLFGRVIQSFMIQGGAPDSRNAGPGWSLGYGDIDEEIDGEIRPNHIPKKGALAAPHRIGMKNSDMSMFFIVQGYAQTREYWLGWEKANNKESREAAKRKVMNAAYKQRVQELKDSIAAAKALVTQVADSIGALIEVTSADRQRLNAVKMACNEVSQRYNEYGKSIRAAIDSVWRATPGGRFLTEAELEAYSTIGGAYHLYQEYTIYGEVVEGLEVIDKIAELDTNAADRPRKDVRMNIRIIK